MPHIHELYDFVVSVFIVHANKILLVYHKKYQEWLPIGGHIELDEDPEQALYREIREECGLKVKILAETPPVRHRGVKPIPTPSYVDVHEIDKTHKHIAFVYFGISNSDRVKLHTREHTQFGWFTKAELKDPELKLVPSIYFYCLKALKAAALIMIVSVFFLPLAFAGEIQYAKVLNVSGDVEVLHQPSRKWVPLEKNTFLKKGVSVHTHANSRVWMAFDPQLETLVELAENSYLNIWTSPPSRVSLKKGRLYVFREAETSETTVPNGPNSFKVLTRELLVQVPSAGLVLDVSQKGTALSVFGENVFVTAFSESKLQSPPKKIAEGFKFFKRAFSPEFFYERMKYAEYQPWKAWVEKMYELKDDFAAEALEKELGQ